MDEGEEERLFTYIGIEDVNDFEYLQSITAVYEDLKDKPQKLFSDRLKSLSINDKYLTLNEFIKSISERIKIKKWDFLTFFDKVMRPQQKFYLSILENNEEEIESFLINLDRSIVDQLYTHLETHTELFPDEIKAWITENSHQIQQLSLYFLYLHTISIIQNEDRLFQLLVVQFSVDSLYFYQNRFLSVKNQQFLQKYFIQLVYYKPATQLSPVEISTILKFLSIGLMDIEYNHLIYLLNYVEDLDVTHRHKIDAYDSIITKLTELDPAHVIDLAYSYPRARVRNLFIPYFIIFANPQQIINYYETHPSKSSKECLLEELVGVTSDVYFLEIFVDKLDSTQKLRNAMFALRTIEIQDYHKLAVFLMELLDKLGPDKLEQVFSNYRFRSKQLDVFHKIVDRIASHNELLGNKVRAKLRLVI